MISGKVNVASVNGAGGGGSEGGCSEPKEHLEWLETAGIITVQDYKRTKN